MATLDVEALLDATASSKNDTKDSYSRDSDDRVRSDRSDRRDRDRSGDRSRRDRSPGRSGRRDRSHERGARRPDEREGTPRSDAGSHKSRRRSRSRDDDRRHSRRHRGGDGDYYRGARGGRERSRTRSPRRHRHRDDYRDERSSHHHRGSRDEDRHPRTAAGGGRTPKRDATPQLTEDERDRRTVFVQQLAARLRTKELKEFFEKVGPVNEAQIVKDRISGRSKGYVPYCLRPFTYLLRPTDTKLLELATLNSNKKSLSLLRFSSQVKSC
jgi:RNA-binding protein 23/39